MRTERRQQLASSLSSPPQWRFSGTTTPHMNRIPHQCCGSMTFWCGSGSGSGSADPCLWLIDPDSDPAIFVIDLQDTNKKLILKKSFLFNVYLHLFSKIKSQKEVTKQQESRFFIFFCLMIEGSGSRRPKNIWIPRIRIRVRIRNTVLNSVELLPFLCYPKPSFLDILRSPNSSIHYADVPGLSSLVLFKPYSSLNWVPVPCTLSFRLIIVRRIFYFFFKL